MNTKVALLLFVILFATVISITPISAYNMDPAVQPQGDEVDNPRLPMEGDEVDNPRLPMEGDEVDNPRLPM